VAASIRRIAATFRDGVEKPALTFDPDFQAAAFINSTLFCSLATSAAIDAICPPQDSRAAASP
jgi:hypothetical protein